MVFATFATYQVAAIVQAQTFALNAYLSTIRFHKIFVSCAIFLTAYNALTIIIAQVVLET
jgi:hypothetical protein